MYYLNIVCFKHIYPRGDRRPYANPISRQDDLNRSEREKKSYH